ncbi:hypothetical protein [Polyangium jinanense]|uniref:HEAT repeat protein n=1 Tax=Polyangium jinanense TaxID=2829994 RepID=A0A9X3WYV8_9BACT|nr:hypothetical protein [Polyangium jinanense]MDC3953395.1 hypothetical protein [Polyangium jinanense]MDC3979485.1 hypothetical protein [Polyangium jinanense]
MTYSPMFQRFVESVEGVDPKWREDVDMEAFRALDKDERREAEELLMRRLEDNDTRAPRTLAEVQCRGAVVPMQRAYPNVKGRMKVAIALALRDLEVSPAEPLIAEVIRSGDLDGGVPAVSAARGMNKPEIADALAWAALHHPDPNVRRSAGSILIYHSGATDDPLAWKLRPLYLPLGSDDMAVRRNAFREICKIAQFPPEMADS